MMFLGMQNQVQLSKQKNGIFLILAEIPPQITNLIPCARIKSGCFFEEAREIFKCSYVAYKI